MYISSSPTVALRRTERPTCPASASRTSRRSPWFSTRRVLAGESSESPTTRPSGSTSVTRRPERPPSHSVTSSGFPPARVAYSETARLSSRRTSSASSSVRWRRRRLPIPTVSTTTTVEMIAR